jgi:hypothetical protein
MGGLYRALVCRFVDLTIGNDRESQRLIHYTWDSIGKLRMIDSV